MESDATAWESLQCRQQHRYLSTTLLIACFEQSLPPGRHIDNNKNDLLHNQCYARTEKRQAFNCSAIMGLCIVLPTEHLISKISDVRDEGDFFASKILFIPS